MENTFEPEEIEMPEAIAEETETTDAETISFEEEVTGEEVEENPDHDHASEEELEHVSEEEEEHSTDSEEEA